MRETIQDSKWMTFSTFTCSKFCFACVSTVLSKHHVIKLQLSVNLQSFTFAINNDKDVWTSEERQRMLDSKTQCSTERVTLWDILLGATKRIILTSGTKTIRRVTLG